MVAETDLYFNLQEALFDLEAELRSAGLWEEYSPPAEALASQQPFCIDTLAFNQWLQFVFITKLGALVEGRQTLPGQCGVAPMAEEFFRGLDTSGSGVVRVLQRIDTLLIGQNKG